MNSFERGGVVLGAEGALGKQVARELTTILPFCLKFDKEEDRTRSVMACDLADAKSVDAAIKRIPFEKAKHWCFVTASGLYDGKDPPTERWEDIALSLGVNLVGVANFVLGCVRELQGRTGRFVIVTSAAARVGSLDVGYGIAKAGLEGLVRSISKRYASRGITAIGVAPGLFSSPMSAHQSDARREAAIAATHLRREIALSDIVSTVRFAAVDAPDSLTGTFISPNGGQVC